MTAVVAITIGSEEGWAIPRFVRVDLDNDLTIYNVDEVAWLIQYGGCVDRAAVFCRAEWFALAYDRHDVRAGDTLVMPPGGLRFHSRLESPLRPHAQRQIPPMRRGLPRGPRAGLPSP